MNDGHDPISLLDSRTNAINLLRSYVEELQAELGKIPRLEDPLTSKVYRTWDRRTMMKYGGCLFALRYAQAMGDISVAQFELIKGEITALVVKTAATVEMGNR